MTGAFIESSLSNEWGPPGSGLSGSEVETVVRDSFDIGPSCFAVDLVDRVPEANGASWPGLPCSLPIGGQRPEWPHENLACHGVVPRSEHTVAPSDSAEATRVAPQPTLPALYSSSAPDGFNDSRLTTRRRLPASGIRRETVFRYRVIKISSRRQVNMLALYSRNIGTALYKGAGQ